MNNPTPPPMKVQTTFAFEPPDTLGASVRIRKERPPPTSRKKVRPRVMMLRTAGTGTVASINPPPSQGRPMNARTPPRDPQRHPGQDEIRREDEPVELGNLGLQLLRPTL